MLNFFQPRTSAAATPTPKNAGVKRPAQPLPPQQLPGWATKNASSMKVKASPQLVTTPASPIKLEDSDAETPSSKKQRVENGCSGEGEGLSVGSKCGWEDGNGAVDGAEANGGDEKAKLENGMGKSVQQQPILAEGSARLNARAEAFGQVTCCTSKACQPSLT